jgi:hypothetical protein
LIHIISQLRISPLHTRHPSLGVRVHNVTTNSFLLTGLDPDGAHELTIAAMTRAGLGPFSHRVRFMTSSSVTSSSSFPGDGAYSHGSDCGKYVGGEGLFVPEDCVDLSSGNGIDVTQEAWIIGAAGGVVFILLGIFVIVVAVRRRMTTKRGERNYLGEYDPIAYHNTVHI